MIILVKKKTGEDGFHRPIYEYTEEVVENVLIAPSSAGDMAEALDLFGKKAVYTLAVPKGDTHDWVDARVRFFNQEWQTFGFPVEGMEANIPLDWNKKVMVERYG